MLVIIFVGCQQNPNGGEKKNELRVDQIRQLINREPVVYIASQKAKTNAKYVVEGTWEDFKNLLGDRQIYLPIEASYKYTMYFAEMQDMKIDTVAKTVTVTLPQLHIELDGVKILWNEAEENVGVLRSNFTVKEKSQMAEDALFEMYKMVLNNHDNIYQANSKAEQQISLFAKNLGYTAIVNYEISTPIID